MKINNENKGGPSEENIILLLSWTELDKGIKALLIFRQLFFIWLHTSDDELHKEEIWELLKAEANNSNKRYFLWQNIPSQYTREIQEAFTLLAAKYFEEDAEDYKDLSLITQEEAEILAMIKTLVVT
jgi:hypothetical protein